MTEKAQPVSPVVYRLPKSGDIAIDLLGVMTRAEAIDLATRIFCEATPGPGVTHAQAMTAIDLRAQAAILLTRAEALSPEMPTREAILKAQGTLRCALVQSNSSDDQIIIGHVRDAYRLLGGPDDV